MVERRVTVKDVAKRAGVSQATVSYVLNETAGQTITPATQERVREAARDLGYTPSRTARALRSGRSDLVLLLLPDAPVGENLARMTERFTDAMDAHGFLAVSRRKRTGQDMGHLVAEIGPAAVLCLGELGPEDEGWASAPSLPIVLLGEGPGGALGETSYAHDAMAMRQVDHLADAGHRRIGFARPRSAQFTVYAEPRAEGVRRRCAERGLAEPVEVELGLTGEDAVAAVAALRGAGVTGVAAYNDEYAIAVLAGLRLSGLTAPTDLAVIGIDNIPLAALTHPPLTSVALDLNSGIDRATAAILTGLGIPTDPPPPSDPFRVVVRASA
ncbi:LacI family DNA-binding transcriptional regulator [Propioniciclava soli]|uniref:LacI family DNA-binding transcriptional regulator n=1 Tax=Propioniciclava soli TaxID=2775081 RepID=A0ABZ3C7U0_9ACTN|nr:LacI family DNA-binding transcriptional regulator [Propioniciclava soli]